MKKLIDVVNFNADASCLNAKDWLNILSGGKSSDFYKWLSLYVKYNKKVTLGFPGATVSDIISFNSESIDLINNNPEIFELILRPYAHDISLLRNKHSFLYNLEVGFKLLESVFNNISKYYLPPEFMCTNEQVKLLVSKDINHIFINPIRFSDQLQQRIPVYPYVLNGLFNSTINTIPFHSILTDAYLNTIHLFDYNFWQSEVHKIDQEILFLWRDGESAFLIPNTIEREEYWVSQQSTPCERTFLKDTSILYKSITSDNFIKSYPIHSFTAWMKELRMLGYLNRVDKIEKSFENLTDEERIIWLQLINSDILSAVEKNYPVIHLKENKDDPKKYVYTIIRSDKGFVGEEYLSIFENYKSNDIQDYLNKSNASHIRLLNSRLSFLKNLLKC